MYICMDKPYVRFEYNFSLYLRYSACYIFQQRYTSPAAAHWIEPGFLFHFCFYYFRFYLFNHWLFGEEHRIWPHLHLTQLYLVPPPKKKMKAFET